MNRQQFDNHFYQQPDPQPERKKTESSELRKFWFLFVPLGALTGFVACVIGGSGAYFLPVGGITAILLWAVLGRGK